jgi:pimeloyl-ACP methyl ester carboxylesterase/radical SAM superfamily enzyme YgiQ (UPF0313 family)
MKTVLLVNCMGPYELGWEEDQFDLFAARLSRGQGVFGLSGHFHAWGLFVIAENIPAKSTIIEFPTEELYKRELEKGYDYLGIQVVTRHIPRIVDMVKLARKIAPETKIVLGGYGVITLYDPMPHDPENHAGFLLDNADYVCDGEGVAFFRRLLGADPNEPITQYHMPLCGAEIPGFNYISNSRSPSILAALGCPNGCEFCVTSAFFKKKKIRIVTPEECLTYIKAGLERAGNQFALYTQIWDEDFLLDKEYVMRLGELIREEGLLRHVNFFCFASIKSISQFTPEELALCGIGSVWVGVESKFEDVITSDHNIAKRAGRDVSEVFKDFQRYGISTVASTILGWDFHTKENIIEDLEYFVSLKPVFYQISPLRPCPGTQLYGRLKEQGRIYDTGTWDDASLWSEDLHKYVNFEKDELRNYFDLAHKMLYETNGPSVLNIADIMLQGYRTMIHSRNPYLQQRAERCYHFAKRTCAFLLYSIRKLAPSEAVKKRVDEVEKRAIEYLGEPTLLEKLVARIFYLRFLRLHKMRQRPDFKVKSDQPWKITYYHGDKSKPTVKRQHPKKYWAQKAVATALRKTVLNPRQLYHIRLGDIDDFPFICKTVDIEGNLLNYVDEGEGEPVLMLHGNPTWSYLYRHFIKELKNDHRCIALDFLGYGLSDKPPRGDYSMKAHIRRLGEFVERLGLKDITLICQDWGGVIGLSYAARNKDRFKRLIPMNTTGFAPENIGEAFKGSMGAWAFPYLWSFKIPVLGKKMGMDWNVFLNLGMRKGIHNRKRQLHKRAWLGYEYPFQRVQDRIAILRSVRQVPMVPFSPIIRLLKSTGTLLRGWEIRTQIIWGTKDPVFVPWFADKFEEILPNHAPTLRIPTASHFLQDDEPEIVIEKIKEFLAEEALEQKKPVELAA